MKKDLSERTKASIISLIKARPEYQDTQLEDGEVLTYNAIRAFNLIIVLELFDGSREMTREFLIYTTTEKEGKQNSRKSTEMLRPATELEDEMLRTWDDQYPLLERDDLVFLHAKPIAEGTTKRGAYDISMQ